MEITKLRSEKEAIKEPLPCESRLSKQSPVTEDSKRNSWLFKSQIEGIPFSNIVSNQLCGLSSKVPLKFENIINACFENPDRKLGGKLEENSSIDFVTKDYSICDEEIFDTPRFWLTQKNTAISQFDRS